MIGFRDDVRLVGVTVGTIDVDSDDEWKEGAVEPGGIFVGRVEGWDEG